MPFNKNEELPVNIKKLPIKAQTMFRKAFNSSFASNNDEELSFKVAWAVVKKRFKKVNGSWIAKGMGHDLYTFRLENKSTSFITKAADGEFYLEAVLSDVGFDRDGKKFTDGALKDYAKQINEHGIAGFVTHADWHTFCRDNMHLDEDAFVAKARNERTGILKAVKAIYEKGKLWIKAAIDKRYIKQVKKFSKVSIEALVPSRLRPNNEYQGGYVLGFALDNDAINSRAKAMIVNE